MFFRPEPLRGQDLGARLLYEVEAEAQRRGCRRAVVETSTFQAPGFYIRHGYTEFDCVTFGVPSQARVFLSKAQSPRRPQNGQLAGRMTKRPATAGWRQRLISGGHLMRKSRFMHQTHEC